jgi:polar amino acid transport system permease protein
LLLLLLAGSLVSFVVLKGTTANWAAVLPYAPAFWRGWLLTIGISAAALVLSSLLGLATAAARRSVFLPLRSLATLYVEIVRGAPFLVLILIGFYVVLHQVGLQNRLLAGILLLAVFSGAYIAEIFRAGLESVGRSQLESARAIGLDPWQTFRFVVFPQAIRQVLPPLAGQFASLIKDSSLLSIIGIAEFTFVAQQVNSATFSTLESLLPLAPGYLILTVPISLWSRHLERRTHFDT